MKKIGFTGTQMGMKRKQKIAFSELVTNLTKDKPLEYHHGDCKGADEESHDIIVCNWEVYLILHPPSNSSKRAFKDFTESREPKPYLERNKDIVAESEIMIATPKEFTMQWKDSGTWATIRYAKQACKPLAIIYPDGSIEFNQFWNQ